MITRKNPGFELRHVKDRLAPDQDLRLVEPAELRELAAQTIEGAFRPLKSAPSLRPGWRCEVREESELGFALDQLYPGSVADWFAASMGTAEVTHYREYTGRQTGMYRITQLLDDDQAGDVIRAACHGRFCLKRRLWTVDGLPIDTPENKSIIPCFEPCALLMELARKAMRLEQEPRGPELGRSELESVAAALELAAAADFSGRVADFGAPLNPRRLQLLLEKCRRKLEVSPSAKSEE